MNSTENLIAEADSLLSRYKREQLESEETPIDATHADFPILTEVVASASNAGQASSDAHTHARYVQDGISLPRTVADDSIEELSAAIRLQLTTRLTALISARFAVWSSELADDIQLISAEILNEIIKNQNTALSPSPTTLDDRKS